MPAAASRSVRPPARPGALARLAEGTLELVAVLALTLAFFGGFLIMLSAVFPSGVGLRTLVLESRRSASLTSSEDGAGPWVADGVPHTAIASLGVLRPEVKHRGSETIAWDPAHDGELLHDRDAVQTGANGSAIVRFGRGNDLQLERNSLVVVAGSESGSAAAAGERPEDAAAAGTRRGVALEEGELMARLEAPERTRLELSLPNVVARLADTTSRVPARFRLTVRKDHSATVSVLDGRLNLESHSKIVSIGPRQFSQVTSEGGVSAPLELPGAPSDCAPAEGATFLHLDLPPRVTFSWSAVREAGHYRLRAARDPEFREVALDEIVAGDSLTWGRALPGTYWWQVAGIVDGVEGVPTRARAMIVRRDALPPRLAVQEPPHLVREPGLLLRGSADPRARVYVMGRPAETDRDGQFQIELQLQPGANVLVVEVVDAASHTSYWSQVVHLKP